MKYLFIILTGLILALCGCRKGRYFVVMIRNVDGLEKGSKVVQEGQVVGEVADMDLYKDSVAVRIRLNRSISLPLGTRFRKEQAILGDTRLFIEPSEQKQLAAITDTLQGYQDTVLVHFSISDTAKRKKMKEAVKKIMEGVTEAYEAIKTDSTKTSKKE